MSMAQVTSRPSARFRTSPISFSSSGSSLAIRRDSSVLPSAPRAEAVMVALAAVDPRPYPAHRAPDARIRSVRATDDLAGMLYTATCSHFLIGGRVVVGR